MSKLSGGASYLSKESVPAKRLVTPKKSPVMVAISAFFAMLVLFVSVSPLLSASNNTASPHSASAGSWGIWCTAKIGFGMDDKAGWSQFLRVYPLENEKNRVWTLQEAFGSGVGYVNYEGEGKATEQLVLDKSPENKFKPGNYDAVSEKLNGLRNSSSCGAAPALAALANVNLGIANGMSNIVQAFVVFAFDSSIICSDPANPTGACLNLLKVIGGNGSDPHGGLIGTLTGSIYMPLLVIMVTITAFWIGYKGLVQRKLREAMFGAIWVFLSVIFGLALLLNPALLAKAPMAVSNSIASCVIGSFNGQNCMDGSSGTTSLSTDNFSTSSDKICRSIAPGAALDEQMSMTVNSLSCSIWKAFILEPYAQGSFGTSFGSLDTVADTPTKKVIEKAGIDPNVFCVNLGSSDSLASFSGKRAVFDKDTGKVCNLAAYQMFLKTNASTSGSITPDSSTPDTRWYNVVVTAANDDGLWAQWAPSFTNAMHKIGTSILAGITTFAGGIVLVTVAFFALIYYFTAVILTAFAPLFFLMGVHPGRGKKILLGWVEKVVSNVLKYLASAVFLILSVTFYSAILGAASSPALTFLFVIIITGALLMYRKEIINLIGKASMGGEQLSSKFADGLKDRAKGVGGLAMAGIGSGVGAKIAGGKVSSGIKAGIQRDLQRGGAKKVFGNVGGELVSNASRQFTRNLVDNERDLKDVAKQSQDKSSAANDELANINQSYETVKAEIETKDAAYYTNTNDYARLNSEREKFNDLETEAAREMMEENPFFAQAQLFANQMAALKFEKDIAVGLGDSATADQKAAEIEQISSQRELLLRQIDPEDLAANRADYAARLEAKMYSANLVYDDTKASTLTNISVELDKAQDTRDSLVARANDLIAQKNTLEVEAKGLKAKADTLNESIKNIQPGDLITQSKADKMLKESDKAYENEGEKYVPLNSIEHNSMDQVYKNEHAKMLENRGLPPQTTESRNNRDSDGPSSGDGNGGSAPRGDAPRADGPRPQPAGGATTAIPTSPKTETRPIETQQDRRQSSGLPTRPDSSSAPSSSKPEQRTQPVTQPVSAPEVSENSRIPSGPAPKPERAPSVPAQPVSPPSTPAQPQNAPSVPSQPTQPPAVSAQPDRAPKVPSQPVSPPQSAPVQQPVAPKPEREPSVPTQPNRAPNSRPLPPTPEREPSVPKRPENEPMVRDRSNRGVPDAQNIKLPESSRTSRINESSALPSVTINRPEQDGSNGTQRGGIPRRRGPGSN